MALNKRFYINDQTTIPAENMNEIQDAIIALENRFTEVITPSINRLDTSQITSGYYINPNNGALAVNASYATSDFIPVKPGEVITYQYGTQTVHAGRTIGTMAFLAAYDANKDHMADASGRSLTSYTVPEGVAFIRFSSNVLATVNYPAVVAAAGLVDYEPYEATTTYELKPESHDDDHIREIAEEVAGGENEGGVSSLDDLPDIVFTNAYDKDSTGYEAGKFLWNGTTSANTAYFATGFFAVDPDTDYAFFGSESTPTVRSVCEYDENQGFISGKSHGNVTTIHTTANTRFLRVSCYNGAEQSLTVRKGTLATGYTPRNSYKIPGEVVAQDAGAIDAYLPKDIYCAVGRTIELYNNQVCLQADKYHMKWHSSVGKALKRKYSVTGTSALVGDHTLKLGIYNDKLEEVWAGSTTLHIVAASTDTSPIIVPIGDSLTNGKAWLPEVVNLSDGSILFAGTYNWNLNDADGNARSGGHEGRSGFSAANYINGSTYSYGGETSPNVFWDGEKFSWAHYLTESSLGQDVVNGVMIFLGTNGLTNDNTANAGYIKQMVDAIRADDATLPIFVCNTIYRSNQNGIGVQTGNDGYAAAAGVWKYNEDKKIMDMMKKLDALLDSYEGVHMVNLALTHDSEYNFGAVETPVNPRAAQKEALPVESVHPQTQGYYQMADVMFSAICAVYGTEE